MDNLCNEHGKKLNMHCNELDKNFCSICIRENKDCRNEFHKHIVYDQYLEEDSIKKKNLEQIGELWKQVQKKNEDLTGRELEKLIKIMIEKSNQQKIMEETMFNYAKASNLLFKENFLMLNRKIQENIKRILNIFKYSKNNFKKIIDENNYFQKIKLQPRLSSILIIINQIENLDFCKEYLSIETQEASKSAKESLKLNNLNVIFIKYPEHRRKAIGYLEILTSRIEEKFNLNYSNNKETICKDYIIRIRNLSKQFLEAHSKLNSFIQKLDLIKILYIAHSENPNFLDKFNNKWLYHQMIKYSRTKFVKRKVKVNQKGIIQAKRKVWKLDCINQLFNKLVKVFGQKIPKDRRIFKGDIFLKTKSTKSLAFERKKLNSPFLFYYSFGANSYMVFHLLNLVANIKQDFNLYHQTSSIDIEEQNRKIYFCGGYYKKSLNTCWLLDLSNYKKAQGVKINDLNDARYSTSLISTPLNLYVVGGYDVSDKGLNSCEMLETSGDWKKIATLHTSSLFITLAYVYPSYIYCLGSIKDKIYEKLNLKNVKNSQWKVLQITNPTTRGSGCTIQIEDDKIILFGGDKTKEFSEFDLKSNTISKLKMPFNGYSYFGSKLRQLCGQFHIISLENQGKRIRIGSIQSKEYSEEKINF